MKFLIDNALSPRLAQHLKNEHHDATHVRDHGIQHDPDEKIFALAAREDRIIVSADTDFGTLLALRQDTHPSVILFRGETNRQPERQADLLRHHLPLIEKDLNEGAIVIFDNTRIRIRRLPISGK